MGQLIRSLLCNAKDLRDIILKRLDSIRKDSEGDSGVKREFPVSPGQCRQ